MNKLILPLALIIFAACKKDKSADNSTAANAKVKTYTEDITSPGGGHVTATYTLSYDINGRVTGLLVAPPIDFEIKYIYNTGIDYSVEIYNSNVLNIHQDVFHNANSFLDSTFEYNDTKDTTTEKCFYNANNQLIKTNEYVYSAITGSSLTNSVTYTYDADGNMVQSNGTDGISELYEYYPDPFMVYPLLRASDGIATQKHHLIKTHSTTINGYPDESASFTYTFDEHNRISTEKGISDDSTVVIKTYTYY